jgi:hypothetical protein
MGIAYQESRCNRHATRSRSECGLNARHRATFTEAPHKKMPTRKSRAGIFP